MLKFFYKSHSGEIIDFHGSDIWSDEHWIRGYEWSLEDANGAYTHIGREATDKELDVYVFGGTERNANAIRNRMYRVFDADVVNKTPGKLYVGDYYMLCYVTAMSDPEGSVDKSKIHTVLTFSSAYPAWQKEVSLEYLPFERATDDAAIGLDFPYDYPYDYAGLSQAARTVNNPFDFPCKFELTMYGATGNLPQITINGNVYGVNSALADGEHLVIDGHTGANTVIKYTVDFSEVNWFGKRYKENSVFTPIPAGVSSLIWDGSFGFTITLFDERSEPPWEEMEAPTTIDGLMTADGQLLETADGFVLMGA